MSASTDILSSAGVANRFINNVSFANAKRNVILASNDSGYTLQLNNCSFTNPITSVVNNTGSNGTGIIFVNCVMTGSGSGGTQIAIQGNSNRDACSLVGCTITAFNTVIGAGTGVGTEFYSGNIFANNGTVQGTCVYNGACMWFNNVFYNNTVALSISDRSWASSGFFYILNNTFVNNGTAFLASASNNLFRLEDYNHLYGNGTNYNGASLVAGVHDVSGAPLFNNPGSLDFRLQPGSPLIGAGLAGSNIAGLKQMPGSGGGVPLIGEGLVF